MGIPGGKIRNWNFFSSLDIIDLIISKDFSPFYQPLIQYSHFRPFFSTFYRKIPVFWTEKYRFERDRTGSNRFQEKIKIESCLWPGERVLKVEIILHQMVNVGLRIKLTYWEVKYSFRQLLSNHICDQKMVQMGSFARRQRWCVGDINPRIPPVR